MLFTKKNSFMTNLLACLIVVVLGATAQSIAHADDTSPGRSSIDIDKTMNKAREYIKAGELKKATKQLDKVVDQDKSHADAWNLLGFASRKMGDFDTSADAYTKALTLEPDHKGALEYQGELFISQGTIPKAQANLARLVSLCPKGCDERSNLEQALAKLQ